MTGPFPGGQSQGRDEESWRVGETSNIITDKMAPVERPH